MVEDQLYRRGVRDPRILDVFARLPRHLYVSPEQAWEAYDDRPLPIGSGQTISQPYIVAAMLDALRVEPPDRVLEVGTGSGYATALLCELAAHVYSVERAPALASRAEALLQRFGYVNFLLRVGDGSLGWPEHAPFDAILVSAAAPHIPSPLVEQLCDGGRMVLPVGSPGSQELLLVRRVGRDVTTHVLDACRFVPLIGTEGFGQQP